jgi:predicted nucleic acid-binding protein
LNLYAESSAVLSWIFGDPLAEEIFRALQSAQAVVASELTLAECDRVLVRRAQVGDIPEARIAERSAELRRTARHWILFPIDSEILNRVRLPFPAEPLRTLDAIHLATALSAQLDLPDLAILSLDNRVRRSAEQLGFRVYPA